MLNALTNVIPPANVQTDRSIGIENLGRSPVVARVSLRREMTVCRAPATICHKKNARMSVEIQTRTASVPAALNTPHAATIAAPST
jgi:hypothetical protein